MARKKAVEPAIQAAEATGTEAIETKAEDIKAEEAVAEQKAEEVPAAKTRKAPASCEEGQCKGGDRKGSGSKGGGSEKERQSIRIQGGKELCGEDRSPCSVRRQVHSGGRPGEECERHLEIRPEAQGSRSDQH